MTEMRPSKSHASRVLPRSLFSAVPPQLQVEDYAASSALVEPGNQLSVRVDWDGDPGKPGSFEIKTSDGSWFSCGNLDVDSRANDLLFPASVIEGDEVVLMFERGRGNPHRAFAVKAIPIVWNQGVTLPEQADDEFVAVRGEHYQYSNANRDESWTDSRPERDGAQRALLRLAGGVDYEIWVNLQHPSKDDTWKEHDPIVRTGDPEPRPL